MKTPTHLLTFLHLQQRRPQLHLARVEEQRDQVLHESGRPGPRTEAGEARPPEEDEGPEEAAQVRGAVPEGTGVRPRLVLQQGGGRAAVSARRIVVGGGLP